MNKAQFENLKQYVAARLDDFDSIPADPTDDYWLKTKLEIMYDVDVKTRDFMTQFYQGGGPADPTIAREVFQFSQSIDARNARDLKDILKVHGWIDAARFGAEAENHAFLIVQHADHDRALQTAILQKMKAMAGTGAAMPARAILIYMTV